MCTQLLGPTSQHTNTNALKNTRNPPIHTPSITPIPSNKAAARFAGRQCWVDRAVKRIKTMPIIRNNTSTAHPANMNPEDFSPDWDGHWVVAHTGLAIIITVSPYPRMVRFRNEKAFGMCTGPNLYQIKSASLNPGDPPSLSTRRCLFRSNFFLRSHRFFS